MNTGSVVASGCSPSWISHFPPSHPRSATFDVTVTVRTILLTPASAKDKPFKGTSVFWSRKDDIDDHKGGFMRSSHASFFDPTSGWTVQLLKTMGWAKSIRVPTITPVGDETSPPRKQCDLGHWILPRHVIDGKILSPQASLLRLRGLAEDHLVPNLSHYSDLEGLNLQPSNASLLYLPRWLFLPERSLDPLDIQISTGVSHGTSRHSETNPLRGHFPVPCHTTIALDPLSIFLQSYPSSLDFRFL